MDQNALSQAKYNIIRLLYPLPEGSMLLCKFMQQYKDYYGHECPLSFLTDQMDDIILVSSSLIVLFFSSPLKMITKKGSTIDVVK